jgi:hypothetical protein
MTYDGTSPVVASPSYELHGNWEVSADIRNSIDTVGFMVSNADSTLLFTYDGGSYATSIVTNGHTYLTQGPIDVPPTDSEVFHVEYHQITGDDIRNRYVQLAYVPHPSDCTSMAVNVVKGPSQNYGTDFYICDSKIQWAEKNLESQIKIGDTLRILYKS